MASYLHIGKVRNKGAGVTLRITVQNDKDAVTLKLEGSIAGDGLEEFRRQWRSIFPTLDSRTLRLDLCGVTFIDPAAQPLMDEIYVQAQPEFATRNLLTRHFVEQIIQSHKTNQRKTR
jgi:hypothetical protein